MWIIGLLIGLIVGGIVDQDEGAIFGAALGAIAGLVFSLRKRVGDIEAFRQQIKTLEDSIGELRQQLPAPRTSSDPTPENETGTASAMSQDSSTASPQSAPSAAALTPQPATRTDATPQNPPPASGQTPEQIPNTPDSPGETSRAVTPPKPDELTRLWNWLTGGNALVRVGVVILFFGVAFLLKYAYEHTNVPIELRLTGVALGAIVMLVIGWRLRLRKPVYALAIQGGGVGVLYLTVFGAFRLFGLIPGEAAFVLLIAIAVLSALLAIMQNALSLAVLGVSGGFLAPVLASTGGGSHVMLFTYYGVLNLGILAIALYKAWRPLNVLGFVFTFGIGSLWGARHYRDDLFASTEPFLVFFVLLYVVISVIFATRQAPRLKHYVDSTLVFDAIVRFWIAGAPGQSV